MTQSTHAKIPQHLVKYIVDQNYDRYTPEDQAVWRYIMRQLKHFLGQYAHPSYLTGLEKSGITSDRIPNIDEIDAHLEKFGWGAVPVSGFIPPAAFMEFQSIGVLPIASDMRTIDHLLYTPAPDIVHEAAGHAPILCNLDYAAYLRQYGEIARHAIISKQDMDQYEAIRILSDIKEDPRSTAAEIKKAEERLHEATMQIKDVSEAALLSRMNWWTAEYGLIGTVQNPRIFGAGLLSSVGEARGCLSATVKKIPLSVDCVNFSYDITEPQPQLFVTADFAQLGDVLEQLAARLSYRQGGQLGLRRAREAATVNTVQLNSGLQISGVLTQDFGDGSYLNFTGPTQLAHSGCQVANQGPAYHAQGFSSPVGLLRGQQHCLSTWPVAELEQIGLKAGSRTTLEFSSGVKVQGKVEGLTFKNNNLIIVSWSDCKVTRGDEMLFNPNWGVYDMAVGAQVTSVFAGPADRNAFGATEDFVAKRVPSKTYSAAERQRHELYRHLQEARAGQKTGTQLRQLTQSWLQNETGEWLPGIELLELSYLKDGDVQQRQALLKRLEPSRFQSPAVRQAVQDGVALAERTL